MDNRLCRPHCFRKSADSSAGEADRRQRVDPLSSIDEIEEQEKLTHKSERPTNKQERPAQNAAWYNALKPPGILMPFSSNTSLIRSYKGYLISVAIRKNEKGERTGKFACKPDRDSPNLPNLIMTNFTGSMALEDDQDIDHVWQWAYSTVNGLINQR